MTIIMNGTLKASSPVVYVVSRSQHVGERGQLVRPYILYVYMHVHIETQFIYSYFSLIPGDVGMPGWTVGLAVKRLKLNRPCGIC